MCQWQQIGTREKDGAPIWKCAGCGAKMAVTNPRGDYCGIKSGAIRPGIVRLEQYTSADRCPYAATPSPHLADTTLLITHFDRPEHLQRCLASIRQFYPDVPIIVGDNSIQASPAVPDDVRLLIAEPDCGLSALRNKLVAHAETAYVAILEEDFVFTEETDLGKLVGLLDTEPSVGLAAGSLWTDGVLHKWSRIYTKSADGKRHVHDKNGPYNVTADGTLWQTCDVVLNFFVARRELLAANPWPESIKIGGEHYAWFTDLHDRRAFDVAHVPSVTAIHDRSGRTEHYQSFRRRNTWSAVNSALVHDAGAGIGNKRGNLVILGVGHSGTTILSKMLDALGWNVHTNDPAYYENRRVREANAAMLKGMAVNAEEVIRWMPNGWLIKDPRMVVTMPQWLPAFAMTAAKFGDAPTLVYIKRNIDDVLASYERRGEPLHKSYAGLSVREIAKLAERRFQEWPWAKVQLRYEDLAAAVGLWETPTIKELETLPPCKLLGEQLGEVGCGCGAREKKLPVYQCGAGLGPCIERSANKSGLRFNGEKVVVCLGCSKREA